MGPSRGRSSSGGSGRTPTSPTSSACQRSESQGIIRIDCEIYELTVHIYEWTMHVYGNIRIDCSYVWVLLVAGVRPRAWAELRPRPQARNAGGLTPRALYEFDCEIYEFTVHIYELTVHIYGNIPIDCSYIRVLLLARFRPGAWAEPPPRPQARNAGGLISHKVLLKSFCRSQPPHKFVNL